MEITSYYVSVASLLTVVLLWVFFAAIFLLRKKQRPSTDAVSAPRSWLGLALQGASFAIVWTVRRSPMFSPFNGGTEILNIILQVFAVLTAAASVWLALSAVRELGRQWSLQARLIEGHKLVTTGVYATVRHPIYTAMLGMLVATGIVYSHWIVLIAALIVFIIGTQIRVTFEERLLREAFGEEFQSWKARVPGLIPFLKL